MLFMICVMIEIIIDKVVKAINKLKNKKLGK